MRQDHVIAIVLAGALGLGVAIAGAHQLHYRQTQKAMQASEAVQRAETAVVAREDARALTIAIVQRDQAQAQLHDTTDALNASIAERDELKEKVAALERATRVGLGSGPAAVASSAGPNHFPYGYCTWYVASRRYVPWNGNAIAWLWGAQAFGYPTGMTPRPGAIMVTAESGYGHVALVESVNSAAGSFTVSEMNYIAWGMVDWRTVVPGRVPLLGFVY